jgi:hypothetical protein
VRRALIEHVRGQERHDVRDPTGWTEPTLTAFVLYRDDMSKSDLEMPRRRVGVRMQVAGVSYVSPRAYRTKNPFS